MSQGHPAGQAGVYRPEFQGFPVDNKRKLTEKGTLAETPAGCPRDTRLSRGFSEILCDFSYVPFLLLPIYSKTEMHPVQNWSLEMP